MWRKTNDRLALAYYEKAAQQGHTGCQTNLGGFYGQGRGCERSFERAAEWLKRAASTGDMRAQFMLAQLHEHGQGVPKDYLEARRLLTLSSAQGYPRATDHLARLEEKIRTECPLLGTRVRITGTSREDMNGRVGMARSFDYARDRYVVEVDCNSGENEKGKLKLKPGNLVLVRRKGKSK